MEINDDLFDSLAGQHKEKLGQTAKTSVSISMGTDAEQAAINQHIAKITGLPTDVVSGNRQDVENKIKLDAIDFTSMPNTHPATAQHLANPANAAISHDDINSLLNTEACFKNDSTETLDANASYEQRQRAFQMDAIRNGQANLPGFDATGRRISGYVAPALNPDEIGHKLSAADLPGDLLASLGSGAADIGTMANYLYSRTPIGKLNNWVADKITGGNVEADANRMFQGVQETYTGQKSLGMQEQLQAVQNADGLGGTLSALADNPAAILDQTVRQLPQIAVGGGIMRLASGTLTGAQALGRMAIADLATNASMGAADAGTQAEQTVYAMTEQQLQEGSEQYRALREKGESHENAQQKVAHNAGSLAGLIAAPLSLVINKAGSHMDARFMGQLIGEQAAKLELKAALKQVVPTIAIKTLSEAADEGLSSQLSANMGVRFNANEHQDLTQGVMSSAVFGGVLGHTQGHVEAYTSILGAHVENQNKATMSERFTGFIDRLRKASKESATQTRAPDVYADVVDRAAEAQNTDLSHVYLDGKTLMQSPYTKELIAASPSIAAQYVEAVATGGTIKIPIGEYAANIANTEADASIVEHLKQSPSAMSHAQQVEFDATKDEALQQELHAAMQKLDDETNFNNSREAVKARVLEQLQGAGSFNKKQNDAYAEAFAAHTAVRAKQLGITPEEHFKAHGVAFSKGVAANGVLNQSTDKKELLLVHNLTQSNLAEVVRLGGLAAPSLATIKAEHGLSGFGEITLISNSDLLNDRSAKTYNADIYSPRHPKAARISNKNKVDDLRNWISDNLGDEVPIEVPDFIGHGGRIDEFSILESTALKYAWLKSVGVKIPLKKVRLSQFERKAFDVFVKDKIKRTSDAYENKELIELATKSAKSIFAEINDDVKEDLRDVYLDGDVASGSYRSKFLNKIKEHVDSNRIDIHALKDAIRNKLNDKKIGEKFNLFAQEKLEGITSSKEFTPSGGGGSKPYNLENIVKDMTRKIKAGEGFNYGAASIRGASAKELNGVNGVKSESANLVTSTDMDKIKVESNNRFEDAAEELRPLYKYSIGFSYLSDFAELASSSDYEIRKSFKDPVKAIRVINDLKKYLSQLPSEYFETKMQRAVGLGEFNTAIIPNDASIATVSALNGAGIRIVKYNAKKEGDRNAKIASQKDLLFQSSNNTPRANFNPETNQIGIFDGADLSSVLHEFGHHFFENDISIARDLITKGELSPGEAEIVQDVGALLNWLGFNGSPSEALAQWDALTFEEQRSYHEQVAESFEHYLFSGEAPTKELTRVFRMFRNMLLSAYESIKKFLQVNPSAGRLNDEVRGVFDRMLASSEQINAATQSLGLSPLFKTKEEAAQYGLDFAEYHAQNEAATDAATEDMQSKALSDMQWLHNAASKEVSRLKSEHKQQRKDMEVLARDEVLKQPVYQAIKILSDTVRTEDRVEGLDISNVKAGRIDVKSLKGVPNITPEHVAALKDKGMLRGGKINVDVMADHFGYSSTTEFITDILSKPSLAEAVEQKTDEMLIAAHGELPTEKAMYKAATVALHGELRSKIITAEANALAAASGGKKVTLAAVREFAGRLMNGKRIRDIRVSDYTAGEARAAALAEEALKVADEHSYDKKIEAAKESLKAAQQALSEAVGDTKALERKARAAQLRLDALVKKQGIAKSGRVKVAASHMREKLFHNVSAKLAIDADKFVNDSLTRIKKLTSKRDKMGGEYLEQLDAFLERFDLRKSGTNKAAAAQRATLHAFITEKRREQLGLDADEAMPEVVISDDILYGTEAKPYKELTLEEFTDMVGVVDQLVMLARHEREMYNATRNMNFAQAKEAIIGKIRDIETKRGNGQKIGVDGYFNKLPPQHITTIADALDTANQKIIGEFISPENIIDLMEGGEKGVVWELLFKGMSHASDLKADMHEEAFNHFKPFLDAYSALEKAQMNQGLTISGAAKIARAIGMQGVDSIVKIEGVNGENGQPLELPREKIIMVALLNGNVEGADRLSNYGWTREDIQKIVNKLTPKDCDFIESVWDYFDNKSWPKLEALNKRTLGEAPPKVIPSPFFVNGRQMTGGYMRLKYLASETSRAQNFEDATQALTGGLTRSSKTQQGTSKERVEKLSNRPKLTLDVFSGAVSETIHDLAYREVAADTARLLNDNEIAAAIKQSVGNIPYTALRNWVRDTARPITRDMGIAEKMVNWARKRTTINVLSGVKTALQNFTSILSPVGSGKVSLTAMSKYVALAPLRLVELSRNAKTLSGYMRHASESFERDIQEKVNSLTERGKITVIDKMAFYMMTRIDNMVRTVTWSAAFHDGMAKFGNDTAAAIDHADSVTRQTLGSGRDVDLPTFYRDTNEFKRTLTMFSSFMNGQAQLLYTLGYAAKNAENKTLGTAKFATQVMGMAVLPTILSEILMHGWDDGEETPEEKAARFAWSLERYFAGMTVLRDVAAFAQNKITGGYNPGFKLSPIESQIESVAKAADVVAKITSGDDLSMGDERSLIMGVGFLTGTPGKIVADTITGTQAWLNDDAPPTAILTGAPRKK